MKSAYALVILVGITLGLVYLNPSLKQSVKQDAENTKNLPNYEVQKIFEHDGCTGYVFKTSGGFRENYFVKCGKETTTSASRTCGKSTCTEEITTSTEDN